MDDPDDDAPTPRRPTAAELRRHRQTVPGGVAILEPAPEPAPEPDIAWPIEPDRHDAEVLRRAGRDPNEPTMPAETSAIVRQIAKRLREEFSRQLTDAPRDVAAAVNKRLAKLERDFDPVRRVGRWAAGAALAALVAVVGFVYHRGQDEQHVTDELQSLRTLVDKLERKIDQLQTGTRQ